MNSVSKPVPDKIPIDMSKYPNLKQMELKDLGSLVSTTLANLDEAVSKGFHSVSERYFGLGYADLSKQLLDAMFDHSGILSYHPNESNAQAVSEMLGHAINPLHAAFTKENLFDATGEPVSFEEKFGIAEEDFTAKKWLQGLLFYSYYCSLPDFARYLATSDFSLVDEEKHENIAKLIELRPVLTFQKKIGVIPGKLIPDSGFFDAGSKADWLRIPGFETNICPACKAPSDKHLYDLGDITVCTSCKAGFHNKPEGE
jgi:hypothetical protein